MNSTKNLIIYGKGMYAKSLLKSIDKINIYAILDKFSKEKEYLGIPIFNEIQDNWHRNYEILITVLGYPGIKTHLLSKGFTKIIEPRELFTKYPNSLKHFIADGFMWRQKNKITIIPSNDIKNKIISLLADQVSRDTFSKIIDFRNNPTAYNYPEPRETNIYPMYFPKEISKLYTKNDCTILDIGAFDGDTMRDFYNHYKSCKKTIKNYICIEPEKNNILKLRKLVKSFPSNVDIIQGVVGINTQLKGVKMTSNNSASRIQNNSSVNDAGDLDENQNIVPVLDLKSILCKLMPDTIKMDIEGSDNKALREMGDYIKDNKPNLLLSIYHNPEDLWDMALFIDKISQSSYSFYIRQEGHWGLETQLYAIYL